MKTEVKRSKAALPPVPETKEDPPGNHIHESHPPKRDRPLAQGKGIRQVQYMAGHRYVSSTQRYRDYNTGELSDALQQFHPLDRQE